MPQNAGVQIDDSHLYQVIGAQLKQRRLDLRMSQAHLAGQVGLLRTSITNIEAGRQKAPLHVLYALCDALDIEVTELLPAIAAVRGVAREEIAVNADQVTKVPPMTARFIRGLLDESMSKTRKQ